jgi:hypothetical protein
MITLTFRLDGPTASELAESISGSVTKIHAPWAGLLVVQVANDGEAEDVKASARARQWEFVDDGDARPAALAGWTAPTTSSEYEGGLLNLLLAARLEDLNDLRVKLGLLIARHEALEAALAARNITAGS